MKQKHPLSPERWAYIKALTLKQRWIHFSCDAKMVENPKWPNGPRIPWIEKPGVTLRLGRMNKAADKKYEFWRRTHGRHIKRLMELGNGN